MAFVVSIDDAKGFSCQYHSTGAAEHLVYVTERAVSCCALPVMV
jgi:hypothetical protein